MKDLIWRWRHQSDEIDDQNPKNAIGNSQHHLLSVGADLFDIRGAVANSKCVKEWILPYQESIFTFGLVLQGADMANYPEIGVECVTTVGRPRVVALERCVAYFCPDERVPLEGIGLALTQTRLRDYLGDAPAPKALAAFLNNGRQPIVEDFCQTPAMERAALGVRSPPASGAARHFFLQGKLLELLAEISNVLGGGEQHVECVLGIERRRLLEVREVLAADPLTPPDVLQLAKLAGSTPRRLNEAFKQEYGQTVQQWLTEVRFRHAANLLREGVSIKVVSFQLGYSNPDNFRTGFRRRFGASPTEWRLKAGRRIDCFPEH